MACDLDSIRFYSEAMLASGPGPWTRDPKCIPLPWRPIPGRDVESSKKLKLAFMPPHDGTIHAHPPVARALSLCRSACEEAGHEIVDWNYSDHAKILASVEEAFFKLGGPTIQNLLSRTAEPWFDGMHHYAVAAAGSSTVLTADNQRLMSLRRNELQKSHLDRWVASGADAIIMPVSPWSAVREGLTSRKEGMTYIGYTAVWSLLDVSVGTVPVTRATRDDDWEEVGGEPKPFSDHDERIMQDWDKDFYDGTPVCLQVIGGRLEEEKVLGVVAAVADALREYGGGS